MEKLLISACLVGAKCKYSGGDNALPPETLAALRARYQLIPVCPELAGGLPVPREPSECRGSRVISRTGRDVTAQFHRGAALALLLARRFGCAAALLKARSPSCGIGQIYDGHFSGRLVPGDGVAAALLRENGLALVDEQTLLSRPDRDTAKR